MLEFNKKVARKWSMLGPRAVYGMTLLDLVEERDDIFAISADLGVSSGLSRLMDDYPDRYLNIGIAEQNMIGIAAGFAKNGLVPFCSSFAPFASLRCADQIRMNMGYMGFPIKIVALGSGVSMGILGYSHYGLEDMSYLRAIPGMVILSPADCGSVVKAVRAAADSDRPVYIRLTGEPGMPVVYKEDFEFEIGKANILSEGRDIAIIATGSTVRTALDIAAELKEDCGDITVVDMHTIKPIDVDALERVCSVSKTIITLEEHSRIGGLGSAVAEYIADNGLGLKMIRFGLPDVYEKAGDYPYMLDKLGLTKEKILKEIRETIF